MNGTGKAEKFDLKKFWNFSADPIKLEASYDFRCLFCTGRMERAITQIFNFNLDLHGIQEKDSFANDTWMRCGECGYTCVHGVAVPKGLYDGFIDRVKAVLGKAALKKYMKEEMKGVLMIPKDEEREIVQMENPRWIETEEIVGLSPLFEVDCKMCGYKRMFVRHSKLFLVRKERQQSWMVKQLNKALKLITLKILLVEEKASFYPVNRMAYKCPQCDWIATFIVPIRESYFRYLLQLRNDNPLYYPDPRSGWANEDELIKEKLESLGYV